MAKLSLQSPSLQLRRDDYDNERTYSSIFNLVRDIKKTFQNISVAVNEVFAGPKLPIYTVATVPSAVGNRGMIIYISDEVGGEIPAFSDNTNWRRFTDRAIIS